MARAKEAGLDLVEVSSDSAPPVCRILDYGKFRYGSKRKEHGPQVRKQHFGQIKELRLRPKIDKHDLQRKLDKARELLEDGYRLQLTVMFRGREMTHLELGERLLNDTVVYLGEVAKLERGLSREGRRMNIMLMPKVEVVRAKTKQREEQAKRLYQEAESRRKKSKRRDSVRTAPVQVPVDGGQELTGSIELPAQVLAAGGAEPELVDPDMEDEDMEGDDAQAEDAQSAEEKS
jgi:translation initiation factor IF-3